MRIALFSPYYPAPAHTGGRIRIQHFAQRLARTAELHLFAKAHTSEVNDARAREETQFYARIHYAPAPPALPPPFNVGLPQRVRLGSPAQLAQQFAAQHARTAFDVIVVAHAHAAGAALQSGVPFVLDEHNIESRYLASSLAAGGSLRFWHAPELKRMKAWETQCWRQAREVTAVTDEDAVIISAVRSRPAVHVPNGVDISQLNYVPPETRRGAQVLFVGLMDHPPNVHAVQLLAAEIMPRVWRVRPDAELVVCGANPSRAVRNLAGPRITVTGRVPSTKPYLDAARVFANCLSFGAGSSLKVLEAFASGVPLVSTRAGVRGFAVQPDQHYRAAETPDEFAHAIVSCLAAPPDAPELRKLADAGRAFAEHHSWELLAERFVSLTVSAAGA